MIFGSFSRNECVPKPSSLILCWVVYSKRENIEFQKLIWLLRHMSINMLYTVSSNRWKPMLPETIEPLKGKAAAELLEYDKRPLTGPEKDSLQAADTVYSKHKLL